MVTLEGDRTIEAVIASSGSDEIRLGTGADISPYGQRFLMIKAADVKGEPVPPQIILVQKLARGGPRMGV